MSYPDPLMVLTLTAWLWTSPPDRCPQELRGEVKIIMPGTDEGRGEDGSEKHLYHPHYHTATSSDDTAERIVGSVSDLIIEHMGRIFYLPYRHSA